MNPRAGSVAGMAGNRRGRLLGISGPKHCGKSTVAGALLRPWWQFWGRKVVRVRFAGPLKEMLHVLGLDERHTDGDLKELPCAILGGTTPRSAMETLGTDWGRDRVSNTLWLDVAMARVQTLLAAGIDVVIDDVRFDNEARAIHRAGGVVVMLSREGTRFEGRHPSDLGISRHLVDTHVANCGDLSDTVQAVRDVWLGCAGTGPQGFPDHESFPAQETRRGRETDTTT